MPAELKEALVSLDLILDEENARLTAPGYDPLLPELIAAKTRTVGLIEAHWVRLSGREGPPVAAMEDDERDTLAATITLTLTRLQDNARLLERRIALCDDLLGAIRAEARRASGGRSVVYGARGAIAAADQATPISVNTRL